MSNLVENVAKVTAAHAALKEAIAAKGVAVPEYTKLTDMPALVDRIETEWVKPRDWPDIKAMLAEDTEDYEGKLFILYELLTPGAQWTIMRPSSSLYAKIVVDDVEHTETVTVTPDASKRYHVVKLYYTSRELQSSAMAVGSIPDSVISAGESQTGIVPRWVSANGITAKVVYAGWMYKSRRYLVAFEGLTLDKSDYPSNLATPCEYAVRKYFSIVGAGGNCNGLFQKASNIREFDVSFATAINNANNMFFNCYSLAKAPDGLDLSQCTSCASMFSNCYSLSRVPDSLDLSQCTSCNNMFDSCAQLKRVSFAEGSGQLLTHLGYCFRNCASLTYLSLPDGFGKNATNLSNCFSGCTSLAHITGSPNFKVSFSLSDCKNLTHDSLIVVINGLQTVTTSQTLTLGSTNLAKLTDDEKKVATDKGWTLA